MPVGGENVLSLRPPFGGQRSSIPTRALGPNDAKSMLNVWTPDGDIRVRPPVADMQSAFTFPVGRTARLMVKCMPVYANNQFYTLVVVVLDNATTWSAIFDPESGGTLASNTVAYSHAVGWRNGVATAQNGLVFVMNDTATNSAKYYYSGGWVKAQVGTAPHAYPTVARGAGGTLPQPYTFSYRVTYYNSVTGTESEPCASATDPVNPATNAGNQKFTLTLAASGDSQVDKIRIYRMQETVDDNWYLLATVNDTVGTYVDDGSVTPSKTVDNRVNLFGFGITDEITSCCWHKRRMWYAPDDSPGAVIHSELDRPEQVNPLNSFSTGQDASDPVMGMVSVDERLYVLRLRSIDVLTGDSPESFAIAKLVQGVGCVSSASIATIGTRIFFSSHNGIFSISDGQFLEVPLSEAVRDTFRTSTAPGLAVGAVDGRSGIYVCSLPFSAHNGGTPPLPDSTTTFQQLVWDYWRGKWYVWDLQARGVGLAQRNHHTSYPLDLAIEINKSGYANRYKVGRILLDTDQQDFGSANISWSWETGDFDLGIPRDKMFYYATVAWQKSSDSNNITLAWYRNQSGSSAGSKNFAGNLDPPRGKARLGRDGDTIRLKLSGTAASQMRIASIDFDVEAMGPR